MASKGKGKSKHAMTDIDSIKKGTTLYEGAIDNSYYVMAQLYDSQWQKAIIKDCRLSKDFDSKQTKIDSSYEYYIHFVDENRRLDKWVTRGQIQLTGQVIIEEIPKHKKHKKNDEKKEVFIENDEHEGMNEQELKQHEEVTKIKTIDWIQIGKFKCGTWYYSPFPPGYHNIECLYFCEFCLALSLSKSELQRHNVRCPLTHPPGDEIYRDNEKQISVFEIDGLLNQVYCENLTYLGKLFLDHKNLYYNMDVFLFYVLCENDKDGSHFVGYFSKLKGSDKDNLSCILVLPCYQRKGYGKLLITFSYELSLIDDMIGSPERPLSDLGRQTYLSWWVQRIIQFIRQKDEDQDFCIQDIVKETAIRDQDIIWTLEQSNMIKYSQGQISICTDPKYLDQIYRQAGRPGDTIHSENIHYIPFKYKWESYMKYNFPIKDPLKDF